MVHSLWKLLEDKQGIIYYLIINRNTWLEVTLKSGKNREIRRIMQKHSLRVNRL